MPEQDTYPLIPDRITSTAPEYKTTTVNFESGNEQRLANWSNPKTTFSLQHTYLSKARYDELMAFYKSKKGSWKKFYFVNHVDGETYTVRFKADAMTITHINAALYNVDVELVTC